MTELEELSRGFLDGKVLADLRVIARQLNIQGISKLKKDELVEKILEEVSDDGMESLLKDRAIAKEDVEVAEKEKEEAEKETIAEAGVTEEKEKKILYWEASQKYEEALLCFNKLSGYKNEKSLCKKKIKEMNVQKSKEFLRYSVELSMPVT